jgi:signal peptidase II
LSQRRSRAALFYTIFVVVLVLDQLTKWWAREQADWVERSISHLPWPGVFELKLVWNEGVAFGMLQGMGIWLTPIALLIAGFAAWYSYKHPHEPRFTHATLAFLAAGAIGNLIDRLWLGGRVTDLFWIRIIDFPVFNIADVSITIAGVMLVIGAVMDSLRVDKNKEKTEPVKSESPKD